jgi:hypothetical protein
MSRAIAIFKKPAATGRDTPCLGSATQSPATGVPRILLRDTYVTADF